MSSSCPGIGRAATSLLTRNSLRSRAVVQGGLEIYRGCQDYHPPIVLSRIEFGSCGDLVGLLSLNETMEPWIMVFMWVDRDTRNFVPTCPSQAPGTPHLRKQRRQLSMEPNAPPEVIDLTVP
jgi:hypothetical protein